MDQDLQKMMALLGAKPGLVEVRDMRRTGPDAGCYTLPNGECTASECQLHGAMVDEDPAVMATGYDEDLWPAD